VNKDVDKFLKKHCREKGNPLESIFPNISESAVSLLKTMLTANPISRISAEDALCHKWLLDAPALYDYSCNNVSLPHANYFDFDYDKRITIDDLKSMMHSEIEEFASIYGTKAVVSTSDPPPPVPLSAVADGDGGETNDDDSPSICDEQLAAALPPPDPKPATPLSRPYSLPIMQKVDAVLTQSTVGLTQTYTDPLALGYQGKAVPVATKSDIVVEKSHLEKNDRPSYYFRARNCFNGGVQLI
jgi:serine/threonine protein kinase